MTAHGRDSYQHQRLDHAALLAPVTKGCVTIEVQRADKLISAAFSAWCACNDEEMTRALTNAESTDGPALIDAVIDPSSYPETMRVLHGGSRRSDKPR